MTVLSKKTLGSLDKKTLGVFSSKLSQWESNESRKIIGNFVVSCLSSHIGYPDWFKLSEASDKFYSHRLIFLINPGHDSRTLQADNMTLSCKFRRKEESEHCTIIDLQGAPMLSLDKCTTLADIDTPPLK